LAVHSAKDLPIRLTEGLTLSAYLPRADVRDALIARNGHSLPTLPTQAVIGTSSPRRAAQLRALRPDLHIRDLRGNIDTRIAKALNAAEGYDAIVLAKAGLDRAGRAEVISQTLPLHQVLPAPSQGAICLQVRAGGEWSRWISPLDDAATHAAVRAERAFLQGLGGGCALPVAAYAHFDSDTLRLQGRLLTADGQSQINVQDHVLATPADFQHAETLGYDLAHRALNAGGGAWIGGAS
jgi:hydroxymethylbilane synthase